MHLPQSIVFAVICGVAWSASTTPSTQAVLGGLQLEPLIDADLEDLATGLQNGWFTSLDLVRAYTARILEVNSTLHMVTEINPDAEVIAIESDTQRASGHTLGPLHGIPILIKDNIATNDKMNNTGGSWALVGSKVPRDSTMAAKLRKAGAVILGKTNLSEWANFRSGNSSNGWSGYAGQTYAAYYPGQDPSGSSSGSGVAASIGLALGTLGTETSGSILSPSDVNNLVGIKPTVGLTSRYLVIPISEHQDTIGPMTRYVKDAAYILQAIAGPDEYDNYTSANPHQEEIPDYVAACDYDSLSGKRIGVPRNVMELWGNFTDQPVLDAFETAVEQIQAAGATVVEANFTAFADWQGDKNEMMVLNADFLSNLASYFSLLTSDPSGVKSLDDVRSFTHAFPAESYPERDTLSWDAALEQGWNNTSPNFWAPYQANLFFGGEGGILGALERTNTDAIILPTQLSPPIAALVGSPVITVPMGFYPTDWNVTMNGFGNLIEKGPNVPFGLSFMGRKWSEAELIGFAYAYEQRTMHRHDVQPYLAPKTEIRDVLGISDFDDRTSEKVCSADWIARAEMFETWPRMMKALGAPLQKNWWTELWRSSNADLEDSTVVEQT